MWCQQMSLLCCTVFKIGRRRNWWHQLRLAVKQLDKLCHSSQSVTAASDRPALQAGLPDCYAGEHLRFASKQLSTIDMSCPARYIGQLTATLSSYHSTLIRHRAHFARHLHRCCSSCSPVPTATMLNTVKWRRSER
jgi:hypothetical protein